MGDHVKLPDTAVGSAGHQHARAVVRLVQCLRCSYLLKLPVTLPCGNSVCRSCLPQPHTWENVSYPNRSDQQQSLTCPFVDCRKEHPLVDFSLDVTLTKIGGVIENELSRFQSAGNSPILVREKSVNWSPGQNAWPGYEKSRSRVLNDGQLSATYTLAEMGKLEHNADTTYPSISETGDDYHSLDVEALERLKAAARS